MPAIDAVNQFLETMGGEAGVDLTLDSEGICLVENEVGLECEICALPDREDFLLTSLVGETTEDESAAYYAGLMALNSDVGETLGATIGLDPNSGLLMLHQMHSVRGLDQTAFEDLIQEFYAMTESLAGIILARNFTESTPAASEADPDEPNSSDVPDRASKMGEAMRWSRV